MEGKKIVSYIVEEVLIFYKHSEIFYGTVNKYGLLIWYKQTLTPNVPLCTQQEYQFVWKSMTQYHGFESSFVHTEER